MSRQKVSTFIQLYNQFGIQSFKLNSYGTNKSELENHSESLLLNLENSPLQQLSQAQERIESLTGIKRSLRRQRLNVIGTIDAITKKSSFKQIVPL